jgi:TolA-binding protein
VRLCEKGFRKISRFVTLASVCGMLGSGAISVPAYAKNSDEETKAPAGGYEVDELRSEITRLNGRLEDVERTQREHSVKSSGAGSKDDLKKIEARIIELEQSNASLLELVKKLQENNATVKNPEELFKKAKGHFQREEYEEAAENLGTYLKANKIKSAQDATLMRGDCFYKLKEYKKAVVEYSKFPEKYEHSNRMPEALYKIGQSFDALGMKEDAKGFYQELVEKYPKSPEAKKLKKAKKSRKKVK